MKTVLVTGGYGLVGEAIQQVIKNKELYQNLYFIFLNSKSCNLLNYNEIDVFVKEIKPEYIIHLAACVGGLYKNMKEKVKMLEDNLQINTNVLKCAHKYNVQKLIACLSTCIFPDSLVSQGPIDESMLHLGPPHPSNAEYAYAKRILETQCNAYNIEHGTNFVCIVPTNIYGPFDNFNLNDSHVIPGLIHNCYLAKKNNTTFVVKGSGKPLRQFIYSLDLAKLILFILEKYNSLDSIILSPVEEYSIETIAKVIANKFNYNNIVFDDTFSDGQYRKTANNSKLMTLLENCNFEFTPLIKGINTTIEWFVDNYQTLRK